MDDCGRADGRCGLCPRNCGVDRRAGERGFCGVGDALRLAAASVHHGEEPPVSGSGGSGTMFFSGCNLGCGFCQNHQISRGSTGRDVDAAECAAVMLALQNAGAENINIVTGTPHIAALIPALRDARRRGLKLPVLWNTSGYETPEALALIDGVVDGYLPDLKTLDAECARRWFNAPDYPAAAEKAILAMLATRDKPVIIRHLVMPGFLGEASAVMEWFARHAQGRAELSLMTQYTPPRVDGGVSSIPRRVLLREEYEAMLRLLEQWKINDGYYQELETGDEWLPDFERSNPFSASLSTPVWHWKTGFV